MSSWTIYSISFAGLTGVEYSKIDTTLSSLGDWIRINHFHWFLFTDKDMTALRMALRPLLPDGSVVVAVALRNEAAGGFAPQWVWDWLNDRMRKASGLS